MRIALLSVLLLSTAAWAVEPGQASYQRACARCHAASAMSASGTAKKKEPARNGAPDLSEVARTHSSRELREFILAPWKKNPDTGCYTALLKPYEVDDLVAWLQTAARPPVPPREVLLKRNLEQSIAEYKVAQKERQATSRPKVYRQRGQTPVMTRDAKKGGTR